MGKYSVSSEKREELSQLSKEVYGSSSKWVSLMEKGRVETLTSSMEEDVPSESSEVTKRTFKVPVGYGLGVVSIVKRLTLEEVESEMRARQEAMTRFKAMLQKQKDDKEAADAQSQLEKDVALVATGSAL